MFFAIIFIAIGAALLLNSLGWFTGMWQVFWGIIFLAIGIKMITKKESYPMCTGAYWSGKVKEQMRDHECDCDHEHEHEQPKTRKPKQS